MQKPEAPTIEGLSPKEANKVISDYNTNVTTYNNWILKENTELEKDFVERTNEILVYNEQENKKAQESQLALEQLNQLKQLIEQDKSLGYTYQTTDEPTIDLYNNYLTENPLTLSPQGELYRGLPGDGFAVDIHVYLKEGASLPSIGLVSDHLIFEQYNKDDILTYEGECTWVDINQKVTFQNQLKLLDSDDGKLYRFFDGYTNGYWKVTPVPIGKSIEYIEQSDIFNTIEACTTEKYQSVGVVYYYTFVREGEEPEEVELYTPQYKELPQEPIYYTPLEYMNYISVETEKENETNEAKPPREPTVESVVQAEKLPIVIHNDESQIRPVEKYKGNTLPLTGDNVFPLGVLISVVIVSCIIIVIAYKNNWRNKKNNV